MYCCLCANENQNCKKCQCVRNKVPCKECRKGDKCQNHYNKKSYSEENIHTPEENECYEADSVQNEQPMPPRKIQKVQGDGNCFFRCLSLFFHKTEEKHEEIRENIVKTIKRNSDTYKALVSDFERHVSGMEKSDGSEASWATDIECLAASETFRKDILVYSKPKDHGGLAGWQRFSRGEGSINESIKIVFENQHYNLVLDDDILNNGNACTQICAAKKATQIRAKERTPKTQSENERNNYSDDCHDHSTWRWNGRNGANLESLIDNIYDKVIQFDQNNLLKPQLGQSLYKMAEEMTKIINAYNEDQPAMKIAMKLLMIMPNLLMQKPFWKSKTKDDNKAFKRRMEAWMEGEFEDLLSEAIDIQERVGRHSNSKRNNDVARKFRQKMEKGLIKQAARMITKEGNNGVLPMTKETLEKLRKKHPNSTDVNRDALLEGEMKKPHEVIFDEITSDTVKKAAIETKGAAGPSGMDAEMWRGLLTMRRNPKISHDLREAIAKLARKLCKEKCINKEAYINSRLIPLKNLDDVRPIGIGEVLRRIIGQCVLRISRKDVQKAVGNLQVCAGQPAGAEAAIHAMREIYEDSNCEAILLVDARNAFNTLKRKEMLHNIGIICPVISTYVENTYEDPARLILPQGNELTSSEGTTQGDPTAMAIYALGLSVLQRKLSYQQTNVKNVTYADDKVGAGKIKDLKNWWCLLTSHGPPIGYHPNPSKSCLIVKPEKIEEAREIFNGTEVRIESEGEKHLGAVIGSTNFKEKFSKNMIREWIYEVEELSKIAKTEPHSAFTNFIFSMKHKWTYAMRTIPGLEEFLQPLEDSIRNSFLPALFSRNISDQLRELLALPARLGGMGIINPATNASEEYNNSLQLTAQLKELIIKQDNEGDLNMDDIKVTKNRISKARETKQKQELDRIKDRAQDDDIQKRRLQMNIERGASNWLSALPIKEAGFSLNKQEFRDAIFLRYGLSISGLPEHCECGQPFSSDHAMICKKGGFVSLRHNEVRDITAEMLNEVCYDVKSEPELIPLEGENLKYKTANTHERARTDLSARSFWIKGERAFFDIRVFDPVAQSYMNQSLEQAHAVQEGDKNRSYKERITNVEHASFTPLVFTIAGGMGKQTQKFYCRLADMLADSRCQPKSVVTSYMRCRISFSLLRSAILCLRGTRKQRHRPQCHQITRVSDTDFTSAVCISKIAFNNNVSTACCNIDK